MQVQITDFEGLFLIQPRKFEDTRGYFFESFNLKELSKRINIPYEFVQDNQSRSIKGVLRGLHFQTGEHAQAKLVRVLQGEVLDVVVDLRPHSATFGKHFKAVLSDTNNLQMLIPRGFAHGILVLSETADFFYKCDNYYSPQHDSGIIWNDPELNIDWSVQNTNFLISDKDQKLKTFAQFKAELK